MRSTLKLATAACVLLSTIGCTHPMGINSNPPGAKVFVNGNFEGTTPVAYRAKRDAFGGALKVKVEMEGFKTAERTYTSQVDTGEAILTIGGGLVCCVPIFVAPWVWKYPDTISFDMEKGEGTTSQLFRMITPERWVLVSSR